MYVVRESVYLFVPTRSSKDVEQFIYVVSNNFFDKIDFSGHWKQGKIDFLLKKKIKIGSLRLYLNLFTFVSQFESSKIFFFYLVMYDTGTVGIGV